MKAIASNDFYEISFDAAKNRIHMNLKGLWSSEKDIPNWETDISSVIQSVSEQFTVLVDMTNFQGAVVRDIIENAQRMLLEGGLKKSAEIHNRDTFAKMQLEKTAEETGMVLRQFDNESEAVAWLDEQ